MDASDLIAVARQWIVDDPDPLTRAELEAVIDSNDVDELSERMAGSLQFGTAGLRGVVAAGSNRMNRAVVIRTTRGLADYLLGRGDTDAPVVVGADARLSSLTFLEDTVAVLAAAGIPVRFFDEPVPTPLVAYAARLVEAQAAVVITASHNPPRDNGYKVYDRNGAQIIPPVDGEIAAAIADVGPAAAVPRIDDATVGDSPLVGAVPDGWFGRYLGDLDAVRTPPPLGRDLAIVYTPMHGVGGAFVTDGLHYFGHPNVLPVTEQYEPDGRFPTVDFPNPEEPGALDLATALARREGADLIIANDPDTDRLAVSLPRREGWQSLTGNQIGVLLADFLLENAEVDHPLVLNSIVSSPMLESVAHGHGARFVQTLTGFKWIWNAALDLADQATFVFGYEEALGYSVGPAVRDKDGISAAIIFADLAAACRERDETVWDYLARLYGEHGLWVSTQKSIVRPGSEGAAQIAAALERIGAAPPSELSGITVAEVTDYRVGAEDRPRYLAATPLVALDLGARGRALVRPSGTEPKLKIYVDLVADRDDAVSAVQQEQALTAEADEVATALAAKLGL